MTDLAELTRPIIGIENRTAQEVFDMMCDRIRYAIRSLSQPGEGSAGASVGPGAGDLRNGIISEVMAYAGLNTRDAGELAGQIMVRIATSNKGGRDGE